jgi:hypothetical protein
MQDALLSFQHEVMTEHAALHLLPPSPVPPLLLPQPMVRMPQSPMKPSVFGSVMPPPTWTVPPPGKPSQTVVVPTFGLFGGYPFELVDSDVGMIAAWICQRGNDN